MQAAPQTALRAKASKVYARQSRETLEQRWILDHLPLVRHVVSRVTSCLSCGGDVEDLISAGTLGLVKAARAFDPTRHSEFKTYAYIRIRGAVLDELRGRSFVPAARKQNFMSIHGLDDDAPVLGTFLPPDGQEAPDAQAERRELLDSLAAAIRQLPRRDRLVLLLYYERDLTMKETAEVLGITESRVSQIHASALFKLSMKLRNAT